MKQVRNYRLLRPVAWVLALACLVCWQAPPAAAFREPERSRRWKTQTPNAEQRRQIANREQAAREAAAKNRPDVRELTDEEMARYHGRGQYRNAALCGAYPWHRSFRDANMNTGNLFKSFTDIQVPPARGAGLAWQRTWNSNEDREGPFGKGWTCAYEIRLEEDPQNPDVVYRRDFFGGRHAYDRDADGLLSCPPYLHDALAADYGAGSGGEQVLGYTQEGQDGSKKHFFQNGSEWSCDWLEDRHGNRTNLGYYQPSGAPRQLLRTVTDPSARYLEVTWQEVVAGKWRVTRVEGPFDPDTNAPVYVVSYEYHADGNLWKVRQDPAGLNRTTTYTYTTVEGESGLLASISAPLQHTVSYTYARGRLQFPNLPFDTLWVRTVTEPASGGPLTWYLNVSDYSHAIDFPDWITLASLDAAGNQAYDGGVYTDSYPDLYPRCKALGVRNGGTWFNYTFVYDQQNNVIQRYRGGAETDLGGNFMTEYLTYGPHGKVLTHKLSGPPGSGTATEAYKTIYTYYDASKYFQQASVQDPNGNVTRTDYYDKDDPNPGNRGQVKWVRDARYGTTGKQFECTYNNFSQKLTEKNLNDVITQYTYGDAWGNLTQVVQDPGTGRLNRTTTMSCDVAGRVIQSIDPKNQSSTFTYNAVGQPLQANLPGETISYGYGLNGRTESVTDNRGTTTLAYETGNNRVGSVTDPVTGTVSYTYGQRGERLTVSLPGGGTWNYTYSSDGAKVVPDEDLNKAALKLVKITDDQGREVQYSLSALGTIYEVFSNITYQNGSAVSYQRTGYSYTQDYRGLLSRVQNTWHWQQGFMGWQQRTLVQNDYSYDNAGNRLANQISDNAGPIRTESYGYDELSRLASVNYGDGETQAYVFDLMGNRLQKTVSTAGGVTGSTTTSETYSYNAANMLLARTISSSPLGTTTGSYSNDANGNTLSGGGRTNTWDGHNRLVQCTFGTTTTSHTYGSDGLRRRTIQGTNTTDYVLDGQSAVRTFLNGVVDRTYLHGARGPEYERIGNNAPLWYLYDGLGSVLGTIDQNGNLVQTRKYDVYGAVRASTGGSGTKHKFVGGLGHPSEDETGLIYMRARYMDVVTGRFVSEDPERDGPNWFNYCSNNPVNFVDNTGTTLQPAALTFWLIGQSFAAVSLGFAYFRDYNQAVIFAGLAAIAFALAMIEAPTSKAFQYLSVALGVVMGGSAGLWAGAFSMAQAAGEGSKSPFAAVVVTAVYIYGLELLGAMIVQDLEDSITTGS
jgi:RHS repeat-associated protein